MIRFAPILDLRICCVAWAFRNKVKSMSKQKRQVYEFDNFRLDAGERLLWRDGEPVMLPSKAFDLLLVLIENKGRLVDKKELYQKVWADQVVEDSNLTVQMSAIRKALSDRDPQRNPRYIATVAGRGYRFVADVASLDEDRVATETETVARIVVEREETSDAEPLPQAVSSRRTALAVGVVSLIAVALLVYFLLSKRATPIPLTSASQIKSIAVLPFKPLLAESRDESLEMGMADTLIARLSNIREIRVRPISAVRRYAGLEQDAAAAGQEQKVEAVVDGQIQKSGDRIRVTVRLVSVDSGATLWTETFDDKLTDIFTVEDSISERVAGMLAVKLTGEESALVAKHSTNNSEAYQLYLKGRFFWNKRTGDGIRKGIAYLDQAVKEDPNYALAYAGLAESYVLLANYSDSTPQEAYSKARTAATEALKLNDGLAEAHSALAYIKSGYDWDFAGAEREYQRAIELNSNYPTARAWYAEFLGLMGRSTESIAEMRRALELEPLSLNINLELGDMLFFARRYDPAIEQYRKTLDLDSNFVRAHIQLGQVYGQKAQYEEAISELKKAISLNSEDNYAIQLLGYTYAISGRTNEAYKALEELKKRAKTHVLPYDFAVIYAGLGQKDQAFEWLEKAYTERDEGLLYLKVDAVLDSLRSDPRFAHLVRRVGFPQ